MTSSIGQKLVMSLTGLFLISFLVVHLAGNFQLLAADNGESFNIYAHFMANNPLIKTISWGLYAGILLHAVQGLMLWWKNRAARGPKKYAVTATRGAKGVASNAAKRMAILGTLVLAFLFIHMGDFWWASKWSGEGGLPPVTYDGVAYKNLYTKVWASFKQEWIVIAYLIGLVALALHLRHGFWSAFQTLGLNHPRWTPLIKSVGLIISIIIPLAYAVIPVYMYFTLPEPTNLPDMGGLF